jgi:hypothetical protein
MESVQDELPQDKQRFHTSYANSYGRQAARIAAAEAPEFFPEHHRENTRFAFRSYRARQNGRGA